GSKSKYSAKVYHKKKFIQIFSASIKGYPCFSDRISEDDNTWHLTPSKLIYYRNGNNWANAIPEIESLIPPLPDFNWPVCEPPHVEPQPVKSFFKKLVGWFRK